MMAKSKKKRAAAKRKQKSTLKKIRRRKEILKKRPPPSKKKGKSFHIPESQFSVEEYIYWLAHGANYIASDYDTGSWTPIFPDIYEGKTLPEPEVLAQRVIKHYGIGDDLDVALTTLQKAVLAWTVHEREVVYIFKLAAMNRLEVAREGEVVDIESEVREPYVSEVWEVFETIKNQLNIEGEPDDDNQYDEPVETSSGPDGQGDDRRHAHGVSCDHGDDELSGSEGP